MGRYREITSILLLVPFCACAVTPVVKVLLAKRVQLDAV